MGRRAVSQLSGRGMDDVVIIHFNDVYNIEQTTSKYNIGYDLFNLLVFLEDQQVIGTMALQPQYCQCRNISLRRRA